MILTNIQFNQMEKNLLLASMLDLIHIKMTAQYGEATLQLPVTYPQLPPNWIGYLGTLILQIDTYRIDNLMCAGGPFRSNPVWVDPEIS